MILVGLDSQMAESARALNLDTSTARLMTAGTVPVESVDEWVGVDPPPGPSGVVNLRAPEPHPGDVPGTWLHFGDERADNEMWANTSDLIALRAERA